MNLDQTKPQPTETALICFAVKEEAAEFKKALPEFADAAALILGMGKANAERGIRHAIEIHKPRFVLTCGFAGALDPKLKVGDVLFDEDSGLGFSEPLRSSGALPGTFHCAERVAVKASEKAALRQTTRADAVEMESSIIRAICRERGIPSATIRVISDAAHEDLPLDFNALMDSDQTISLPKMVAALLKSPGKIPRLMELQRNTSFAARQLSKVLCGLLRALRRRGV